MWFRPATAQVDNAVAGVNSGDCVRVSATSFVVGHVVETVRKLDADSLRLDSEDRGLLTIPLRSLAMLEVSRGKKTHTLSGFGIGLLGGAAVGFVIGSVDHQNYDVDPRPIVVRFTL